MAWLDAALLRYVNSDPNHSVIEGQMHWGIMFHKAEPHHSETEMVSGGCNFHHCSVGVCFVGSREARTDLSLWLGWTQHYYGM